MGNSTSKRLFIACPVRNSIIIEMLTLAGKQLEGLLPAGCEITREPEYHITLRFLGEVDLAEQSTVRRIIELVKDIDHITALTTTISFSLGYLHTFPGGVVWCSLEGTPDESLTALTVLQDSVDKVVVDGGWPSSDYPFLPHITLGRFPQEYTEPLMEAVKGSASPASFAVRAELGSVELLESVRGFLGIPGVSYVPIAPPALFRDVRKLL